MHRDANRHNVVRIVAEWNPHHAHKALDGGACGRHQQQRQGNLAGNQGVVKRFPRTVPATLRVLACMVWLISGRASCNAGNKPKIRL
jgi:hypothetical protein